MQIPPIPANEVLRLAALRGYALLDTPAEPEFDDLTMMAAEICEMPIALLTFVDADRQWVKSSFGTDLRTTPRPISFCGHAILGDGLLEVPNALEDLRFHDNPLVTGQHNMRFYAGAPLISPGGFRLGTLCVIDRVPRHLSDRQRRGLSGLARQVMRQIEARAVARSFASSQNAQARRLRQSTASVIDGGEALALKQTEDFLQTLIDALPIAVYAKRVAKDSADDADEMLFWNRTAETLFELEPGDGPGTDDTATETYAGELAAIRVAHHRKLLEMKAPISVPAYPIRCNDGSLRTLRMTSLPLLDDSGEVAYELGIAEDITALKDAELEVRRAARVDDLTELPNRARFFEALTAALARSQRHGTGIGVLFLDIDQFRRHNELLGRKAGDLLLQEFSTRVKHAVRVTDTVARLAGDEFAIVLEGLHSAQEADLVTRKILATMQQPWLVDGNRIDVTASAGVAFDKTHAHSASALIGFADELLYVAKSAGGDTFRITIC